MSSDVSPSPLDDKLYIMSALSPSDYKTEAVLSKPSPAEECPLMFEPMQDYRLTFAPDHVLLPQHPALTKITLDCGHSFSALACVYFFCRQCMRCPMCRKGVDQPMDTATLEPGLREKLAAEVGKMQKIDQQEDEMEAHIFTVHIILTELRADMLSFSRSNHVIGVVHLYDNNENSVIPVISVEVLVKTQTSPDNALVRFVVVSSCVRMLSKHILDYRLVVKRLETTIAVKTDAHTLIVLDRSPRTAIQDIFNCQLCKVQSNPHSYFEYASCPPVDDMGSTLLGIEWSTTVPALTQILLRQPPIMMTDI